MDQGCYAQRVVRERGAGGGAPAPRGGSDVRRSGRLLRRIGARLHAVFRKASRHSSGSRCAVVDHLHVAKWVELLRLLHRVHELDRLCSHAFARTRLRHLTDLSGIAVFTVDYIAL